MWLLRKKWEIGSESDVKLDVRTNKKGDPKIAFLEKTSG
jgi:hypothetical protein